MQVTISSLDAKGRGIARGEHGADVAVPFTAPGDVVRVSPHGKRRGVRIGAMEAIVTPSPDRMTPRCPYAGRCGGCPWQMFDYAAQLRYKRESVIRALRPFLPLHLGGESSPQATATACCCAGRDGRGDVESTRQPSPKRGGGFVRRDDALGRKPLAHMWSSEQRSRRCAQALPATPGIPAVLPSPEQFYYRNRMDYVVGAHGELGLHEPGSWSRVLDLSTCFLLSEDGVRCMDAFRASVRASGLPAWDPRSHTGFWKYLVLREGKRTGDRMAIIITAPGALPARDTLIAALAPYCRSILHGTHAGVADTSTADEYEVLHGKSDLHEALHIHEKIGNRQSTIYNFTVPPTAFFQTNTLATELLVDIVHAFAALSPTDTLLDLYCGVGVFSIALAGSCTRVIGVESERAAIDAARTNAAANDVANVKFTLANAEAWPFPLEPFDCAIVDPPRSGIHPKVIEKLRTFAPARIVYVSCNPLALAHDLRELTCDYHIERIQSLDLFPHSYHVETVVRLVRR